MSKETQSIVLSGNAYDNFVDTIKTTETLWQYKYGLVRFMNFLKITDVDNLIVLAQNIAVLQQKIIDYISYLEKEKTLGGVTINLYLAPIFHFYSMNDVVLNRKKIGKYIPEFIKSNEDRAYTREEIATLLEFCNLRNRAIILLFASTGMRVGAVPDLCLSHIKKIYDEKTTAKLYQITVYEGYKEEYICFCTPEARNAIDNYLDYRERCGESLSGKSPLFRDEFDVTDIEQVKKRAKKLTKKTISLTIARKLHVSGVMSIEQLKEGEQHRDKRKPVMVTHGFRKFVNTTMINCRIDSSIRNKLLGHNIGLDKSYWKPQVNDLLQEYLKVVDALTINEENRLKRKVEELTVRVDKLDELEEQMNRLSKKLGLE